jgi:hypothetical protein
MADFIENELWVTGPLRELKSFREQATEHNLSYKKRYAAHGHYATSVLCFHRFLPIPDDLSSLDYDSPNGERSWQKEHWGVQWGALSVVLHPASLAEFGPCLVYVFDTASDAPIAFLRHVSKRSSP